MNKDFALVILYDLTLTIGSEVTLDKLLPKVMQRFLFHLSYPVGLILKRDTSNSQYHQIIDSVGDYSFTSLKTEHQSVLITGVGHEPCLSTNAQLLSTFSQRRKYTQAAWFPIDGEYSYLFLTDSTLETDIPLNEVFSPVIRNLARAIGLCQRSEQLTQNLTQDRDEARAELAKTLQKVEHERAFLTSLKNTIPDLVWLKDKDGIYLSCNPKFEALFGHKESEIVGKTDFDFVSKELAEFFRAHDKRAMYAGKAMQNEEWLRFAADGYEGLFQTTKIPMYDDKGALLGVLGIAHDITELKAAQDRLQLSASVFRSAREGIMITSPEGKILEVNDMFCSITGYVREEAVGQNPRILNSGRHSQAFYQHIWASIKDRGHWSGEIWNRRKNGEEYPEVLTITAVKDAQGTLTHYVALFADITEIKRQQRELERMAHFDPLTGLANRSLLADRLSQGMYGVKRRSQSLAVAFLDFDGFKLINDQFGHQTGDQLLSIVAGRMSSLMREGDTLARWGGDEFIAVFMDLHTNGDAEHLLQRLLKEVEKVVEINSKQLKISASIGVTYYPQSEDVDADQLLRQADQAMYQAKLAGKGRLHTYDPQADKLVRGHNEAIENVLSAIHQDQFELFYQPKVNMRTGELIGLEALLRWRHPERGLLPPSVFISTIENHPIAIDVGHWVLNRAIKDIQYLESEGIHTKVSINVSALELQQPDFVGHLSETLSNAQGVKPGQLELELLESSALQDINQVSDVLRAVQLLGVTSAIDDFGTGYSSLTYLKRLPAQTLKIDQSFVRDMVMDAEDVAILEGIIGLAKAFDRQLIAEGVETIDHGVMLLQLGCELGQGYGIARPMPLNQLLGWLTNWTPNPRWQAVHVITEEDRPLFFAGIEHRAWAAALEEYLRGMRKAPPPLGETQCQFGKWLNKFIAARTNTQSHYAHLVGLHHRIHQHASSLVSLNTDNKPEKALAGLPALHEMKSEFLLQLEALLR
ncbi:EAL domain-containing protein [Leeia sp. TBRC 13508]|uniref:EAL domain-containing protein n=1 Tax=Leeia speluncae TaxID=2884804 RepID=A0ABS8DA18_9NEIS|nr:EAL domain-containing protein [Leeia speluncae]MCB6185055.1 EAL domain-containing protein [Leeia speluncae]